MSTPAGLRRRTNVPAIPATATSPKFPAVTKDAADKSGSSGGVLDVLGTRDWIIIAVLIVVGAITRFYRIHDPKDIIFDETHFNVSYRGRSTQRRRSEQVFQAKLSAKRAHTPHPK